jgi:dipeptidyl aminopeptidase/acylaminoacyl peptidase
MPWEGSELVVAEIAFSETYLRVTNSKVVAGRNGEISVGQPQWASNNTLVYLNDVSGFLNPWSYSSSSLETGPISARPIIEDFADCGPSGTLGRNDYAVLSPDTVLFASIRDGRSHLWLANLRLHSLETVSTSYVHISHLRPVSSQEAVFIGKKDDEAAAVVHITLNEGREPECTASNPKSSMSLPRDIISKAQSYSLPMPPSNEPVHLLFYAPLNPRFSPLEGETPPAVISIHGGPTGRTPPGLDWAKQFWTSRGWAW